MKDLSVRKTSEFLTTGQIAAYCGVNFRTVIRWIKRGLLQAQRLPGRGDHRVTKTHFIEFLKANQFAIPVDLDGPITDHSNAGEAASSLQPARILVVDDDTVTASAIHRVLKLQKYDVAIANSGFEAGRMVETFRPALITLDLLMQGVDGIAVLKELGRTGMLRTTKVIVISGDTDHKIKEALSLGAFKALRKPFRNKELVDVVAEALKQESGQ